MNDETYKVATKIREEIAKLEKEYRDLMNDFVCKQRLRRLFIKQINCYVGSFNQSKLFDLTDRDLYELGRLRVERIEELNKALENLTDDNAEEIKIELKLRDKVK